MRQLQKYLAHDFVRYLKYSLKYLGFSPAQIQLEIAEFIMQGNPRTAVFAARGWGKTYIGCLFVTFKWLRNKHLKIKCMSNSHVRSIEISGQILHFLRTLPWVQHLAPKSLWTSKTKFNIRGAWVEKEPSFQVMSCGSRNTGGRIDFCVFDDIESEDADNHEKRQQILKSAQEVSSMLHSPESRPFYAGLKEIPAIERMQVLCLGTYASTDSIHIVPSDDSPHFLRGAAIRKWPALDKNGQSTFPERASTQYLVHLKTHFFDSIYWSLQFMLDPDAVQGEACPYKIEKINGFAVSAQKLPLLYAVIDPAAGGDFTACIIGGVYEGKLYVHDILAYNNMTSEESLSLVADAICKNPSIKVAHIEGNNAAFAQVFQRIMRTKKGTVRVEEFHAVGEKHRRTLAQLEPSLNSGDLVLNRDILTHPQLNKEIKATTYKEGPPAQVHDDVLDAMASFFKIYKDRIGRAKAQIYSGMVA